MVPLHMLSRRVVYCGCMTAMFQTGALQLLSYYLPLWFQTIKGASPTTSGVMTLPSFLSQILFSLFTGYMGMSFYLYSFIEPCH